MTNITNTKNTEQNQSQSQPQVPILIAVDHGYGNIKTEHAVFPACVTPCESEPMFATDKLQWAGRWYIIGEGHKEFIDNKTADEDYLLLTMAAIAKELQLRRRSEAAVYLAAGLPLTWYGQQKESFRRYLTRLPVLEFSFGGTRYTVRIIGAEVYAQGFAAVCHRLHEFTGSNMLCDIGSGTVSMMFIHNGRPVSGRIYMEKLGAYQCVLAVREAVNRELHISPDDLIIEQMLRTGTADVSERVLHVMRRAMRDYAAQVMKTLREHGYQPETTRLHIMGGGAGIIRHFGEFDAERVFFLNDIHASAKGYRRMAERALQAKGLRYE